MSRIDDIHNFLSQYRETYPINNRMFNVTGKIKNLILHGRFSMSGMNTYLELDSDDAKYLYDKYSVIYKDLNADRLRDTIAVLEQNIATQTEKLRILKKDGK